MRFKPVILFSVLFFIIGCSKAEQEAEHVKILTPYEIENLKFQASDVPIGFWLYSESTYIPKTDTLEVVCQYWRCEDLSEQKLMLYEKTILKIDTILGSALKQTWFCKREDGKYNKIEIDIAICSTDSILNKTAREYTSEMYAIASKMTDKPIVGDKSWIPDNQDYFHSIMFIKYNVFVRLFLGIDKTNSAELQNMTRDLAKVIENKICNNAN